MVIPVESDLGSSQGRGCGLHRSSCLAYLPICIYLSRPMLLSSPAHDACALLAGSSCMCVVKCAVCSRESLPLQSTHTVCCMPACSSSRTPKLKNSKMSEQLYVVRQICLQRRGAILPSSPPCVLSTDLRACSARTPILMFHLTIPRAIKSAETTARVASRVEACILLVAQHNVQSIMVLAACRIQWWMLVCSLISLICCRRHQNADRCFWRQQQQQHRLMRPAAQAHTSEQKQGFCIPLK